MGAIVESDFDTMLDEHDALLTRNVRLETIIDCAKLCADRFEYKAAAEILKLAEES